jgi:hypothetical protein
MATSSATVQHLTVETDGLDNTLLTLFWQNTIIGYNNTDKCFPGGGIIRALNNADQTKRYNANKTPPQCIMSKCAGIL